MKGLMEQPTINFMDDYIQDFIGEYWGMDRAERAYRARINLCDDDYDGIKTIYEEIKKYLES